ncbi:MAG: hypothetical protein IKL81_02990, partial [Clostridia bacterium]|nr:hypothetical protein [Clostridia bacterium]
MDIFAAFDKLKKHGKAVGIAVALVLSIALIILGSKGGEREAGDSKTASIDLADYRCELEESISALVSGIDGVKSVRVMVMLADAGEEVYAQNDVGGNYVVIDGDRGLLVKQKRPSISGVAVVCRA